MTLAGTLLGGAVNYNLFILMYFKTPITTLVPMYFGGPYNVKFNGFVYVPK